jgi:nucleotide-binding universal stress UspA family protein
MFLPNTILHPTDFSGSSRYALQIATDLAVKYGSRIIILHAVETLGAANATFGEVATQLEPEGYWNRLWNDVHQVRPAANSDVSIDYQLVEGDPASAIVRIADEQHCDLIVMGTHGHRGLERLLMGSVAEQVVRRATCAVLTVKRPASAAS